MDDPAWLTAGMVALGAILGLAAAFGMFIPITALILFGVAIVIGLRSWRTSIVLMLGYIPVSGVLYVATYPSTAPAALLKDFFFVLPAYAGFFGAYLATRRRFTFDGFPIVPVAMFAGLVLVEIINPTVPSLLVGMVGAKVWLFYIPLAFLGFHLIRGRRDLDRLINFMCLVALVPAVVGILEAALIYTGHSQVVYALYGDAARTATQGFVVIPIGGANLVRIPSTFPFVTQYYVYMTAMVAIGYAWWHFAPQGSPQRLFRGTVWAVLLIAAMASGQRGAFVFIPLLMLGILYFDRRLGAQSAWVIVAFIGASMMALAVIGAGGGALVGNLITNSTTQLNTVVLSGAKSAVNQLLTGLGTGMDTNATRYLTGGQNQFLPISGWQESYLAKYMIELGIGGLLLGLTIYGTIVIRSVRLQRRLRNPAYRTLAACIIGLMIWTAAYGIKTSVMDIDPMNVYFWLFTGILFKLGVLDRAEAQPGSGGSADGLNGQLVSPRPDQRVDGAPRAPRERAHAGR
jgi:hypothetical protein